MIKRFNVFKRLHNLEEKVDHLEESLRIHKKNMHIELYGRHNFYREPTSVSVVEVVKLLMKQQSLQLDIEPGKAAQTVLKEVDTSNKLY